MGYKSKKDMKNVISGFKDTARFIKGDKNIDILRDRNKDLQNPSLEQNKAKQDKYFADVDAAKVAEGEKQSAMMKENLTKPAKVISHPNGSVTEITYGEDGSINYTDFSKEDWNNKVSLKGGGSGMQLNPEQQQAQENEDRTAFMQRMEQGMGTKEQQAEYEVALQTASLPERQAKLQALMNKYGRMPTMGLEKSSTAANKAGFIGAGVLGSVGGIAGGAIAGGLAGSVVPGVGTLAGGAIGAILATGNSLLANQGKGRSQDIANAKSVSREARRQIGLLKTRALNPNEDMESVVMQMYQYEGAIRAAEQMIYDKSIIDTVYRIDQGADELYQIELYKLSQGSTRDAIMFNLLNRDEGKYNAEIGAAIQNYKDFDMGE